ncbi:hypothetical protein B0I35DRAFT_408122 [Stachybotrys elegans]|uniref:Glucan 4-alpha-glucosidase n=1 Tax=Stachybotrys elegans TaxID=80388 RepID=A0A8K0WU04_9HYPO|nr:hypothetical protein B0I35DRAFT_408122 [Stachybotrys elegans]
MSSPQSPPKRPRLSLQIKTSVAPSVRPSRAFHVDPKDPTAFNTLSNAYVSVIERSTPVTAINTLQSFSLASPIDIKDAKHRVSTPQVATYPETPLSAHPSSPRNMAMPFPSAMTTAPTTTPPLSADVLEPSGSKPFSFAPSDVMANSQSFSPATSSPVEHYVRRGRAPSIQASGLGIQLPYTHPRALHSILRNSPLSHKSAPSPRRLSVRIQEKAPKKVGYNTPLTQEITNNKYIKSHIDLLVEEASPHSPPLCAMEADATVDIASAFQPNEIQDGGQTPGPFEDVQRRLAECGPGGQLSPSNPNGIRKRRHREKKRRWVWTIGQEEEEDENQEVGGAVAAIRAEAARTKMRSESSSDAEITTPTASVPPLTFLSTPESCADSTDSGTESVDTDMSDAGSSHASDDSVPCPADMDIDLKTPTAPRRLGGLRIWRRDSPIPELTLAMPVSAGYH